MGEHSLAFRSFSLSLRFLFFSKSSCFRSTGVSLPSSSSSSSALSNLPMSSGSPTRETNPSSSESAIVSSGMKSSSRSSPLWCAIVGRVKAESEAEGARVNQPELTGLGHAMNVPVQVERLCFMLLFSVILLFLALFICFLAFRWYGHHSTEHNTSSVLKKPAATTTTTTMANMSPFLSTPRQGVPQPYDAFLVLDVEATCLQGTDFQWPNEIIVRYRAFDAFPPHRSSEL